MNSSTFISRVWLSYRRHLGVKDAIAETFTVRDLTPSERLSSFSKRTRKVLPFRTLFWAKGIGLRSSFWGLYSFLHAEFPATSIITNSSRMQHLAAELCRTPHEIYFLGHWGGSYRERLHFARLARLFGPADISDWLIFRIGCCTAHRFGCVRKPFETQSVRRAERGNAPMISPPANAKHSVENFYRDDSWAISHGSKPKLEMCKSPMKSPSPPPSSSSTYPRRMNFNG